MYFNVVTDMNKSGIKNEEIRLQTVKNRIGWRNIRSNFSQESCAELEQLSSDMAFPSCATPYSLKIYKTEWVLQYMESR